VHSSGVVLAVASLVVGKTLAGYAALSISVFLVLLSWLTRNRDKIRQRFPLGPGKIEDAENQTYEFVKSFEREKDMKHRPYFGAIMFMLSVGLTFLVFPEMAAVVGVLVVSISDSASTLVGVHLGETKLPHNNEKSLEGSSAFFLTSTLIALLFTTPLNSFLIALAGASVESLPLIDDNFSVPLTVALLFTIL